jgi:hypothetical protein
LASVALDMQMVCPSRTLQRRMTKLFNLFNVKNGSVRPSLPTGKANDCRDKLVNAGKLRELGNNNFSEVLE